MPCVYEWEEGRSCGHTDMIKQLDRRTAFLCTVLGIVGERAPEIFRELPADVQGWWKWHQEFDRKRGAEEALRKKILEIEAKHEKALKAELDALKEST